MVSVVLIGLGLSMDAFCVSVTSGLSARRPGGRETLVMALYFGAFQFLMPVTGCLLAGSVSAGLSSFGPYISFCLLAFIGGKMAWEALRDNPEDKAPPRAAMGHGRLLALAVATSIDALAVGVGFAFMDVRILPASGLIGGMTFVLCVLGGLLGRRIPLRSGKTAEIAGGLVLIAIGVKILFEGVLGV